METVALVGRHDVLKRRWREDLEQGLKRGDLL